MEINKKYNYDVAIVDGGVTGVKVKQFQNTLANEDIMIHFDDALISENQKKGRSYNRENEKKFIG